MMTIYPGIFFFSFVTSAFFFFFIHFYYKKNHLTAVVCMYVWSGDGIWLIEVDLEHQSKVH